MIFEDLYIIGSTVAESLPSSPGDIRAYDAKTGELRWVFHTIPHPGEFGYDTWPKEAYKVSGGANAWAGLTVDHKLGMVYGATGSAAFDFYGANRHGDNLFANTILALDARTGKRVWHFQGIKHDLWDLDFPAPPSLVTVTRNGKPVDALAQVTKTGHVWLLDRKTGATLFPIETRKDASVETRRRKGEPDTTASVEAAAARATDAHREHADDAHSRGTCVGAEDLPAIHVARAVRTTIERGDDHLPRRGWRRRMGRTGV